MRFKDLAIGETFHTGKSYGMGQQSKVLHWLVYQKVDKSHAICVNQVNYGNTRMVGHTNPFNSMQSVWKDITE